LNDRSIMYAIVKPFHGNANVTDFIEIPSSHLFVEEKKMSELWYLTKSLSKLYSLISDTAHHIKSVYYSW
jgi:hypothetical protein